MDFVKYKQRLREFNSTEKYLNELEYLCELTELKPPQKGLDYGCGLGSAMKHINTKTGCEIFGYDVHSEYYEGDKYYFRREMYFPVDVVYFMHSFAHIPNPAKVLQSISENFLKKKGKLIIITPNASWIELNRKPNYISDETVVKHYTMAKLIETVLVAGFINIRCGGFGAETGTENERLFITATT